MKFEFNVISYTSNFLLLYFKNKFTSRNDNHILYHYYSSLPRSTRLECLRLSPMLPNTAPFRWGMQGYLKRNLLLSRPGGSFCRAAHRGSVFPYCPLIIGRGRGEWSHGGARRLQHAKKFTYVSWIRSCTFFVCFIPSASCGCLWHHEINSS